MQFVLIIPSFLFLWQSILLQSYKLRIFKFPGFRILWSVWPDFILMLQLLLCVCCCKPSAISQNIFWLWTSFSPLNVMLL